MDFWLAAIIFAAGFAVGVYRVLLWELTKEGASVVWRGINK